MNILETLIAKHKDRLTTMKDNRAKLCDHLSDEQNNSYDSEIRLVAEFITDLKTLQNENLFIEAITKFPKTLEKLAD